MTRFLVFLAVAASTAAQTPQKVIDQYLRAAGGAKALAQIRTESIAGNVTEDSTGKTGTYSLITKAPNRFYSEIVIESEHSVDAYNGMSAWGQHSQDGARTLTGVASKDAEAWGRYWNSRLADIKKAKLNVQLRGVEKVRGRDADHVQVLLGPGVARDVFFDARTHLIVRETVPAREGEPGQQFDYDDYRQVSGIQTPYRVVLRRGGRQYRIAVTHAEFNAPVDDSVFDFPRAAGASLPDIKALLMEVTRNQKAIEEMQKEYTCHVTTEEEKFDSKGRSSSRTVTEAEVFYIAGDELRHVVAKDGKPLAGNEKKKEDDRFNKEFETRTRKAENMDPKKREQQEAKEQAQISDFLRAVRFTNARRERFRGQDVIAVDFGPNPDYKPKKAIENIIQKLAGVIWIDEQARDVARLEGHFSDSAKLGGGVLASLDKGSSFVFEQAKVNNEVWLPVYDEFHIAGRILLLVKLKANETNRYTDYKKFHADSKIVSVQQE